MLNRSQAELSTTILTLRSKFAKDFTTSLKLCEEKKKLETTRRRLLLKGTPVPKNIIINAKYPDYLQSYYTAGDLDQFLALSKIVSNSYDREVVIQTFSYLFYKYKKAIYIRIRNNKVETFLPFTNADYTNEWGIKLKQPPGFRNIPEFLEYVNKLENRYFDVKRIQPSPSKWYANNCLFRYEKPFVEDDTSIALLHNMVTEVCANEKVKDSEFFIHKRDFPVRRLDGTESYESIFGKGVKLLSHDYKKYSNILCFCTSAEHADLNIPTWEDWCVASQAEKKYFTDSCRLYDMTVAQGIDWNDKLPTAVWRGSTTGCGVTPETNPRLKLVCMSSTNTVDEDGKLFLDAGITKWNLRPRAVDGVLQTIPVDKPPLDMIYNNGRIANRLDINEQARYKYIINVDGHVSAFRLTYELATNSVILLADDSMYYTWYRKSLIPWIHYVPIKSDLSDLYEKIRWCKGHDLECHTIAENALEFYKKYLNKSYMMFYFATLLNSLV